MPKKKSPKIGRRFKGRRHSRNMSKELFETIPLQMNQIINENHCVTIQNKHLCRTCLSETNIGEFHMVFEESISEMLATLAKVEVSKDDGLPSYICKLCKSKLDLAYAFQIQCRKSDDLLRKTKENNCNLKDTKTTSYHNHVAFDELLIKPELGNNLKITENNEQKLFGEMTTPWITNEISSNSDCNLKDTKITMCCNNTEFNEAFKKPELGNNFKITKNNEQKFIGEMQTCLATNVISSNGDCDIKETEIIFGNTKVSNKDTILIKTELEDIDFKITENNERMLIGEMTTPRTTNEISSNSDNIKESEIVGNEQVSNKNVKAINTELESNIGRNETSEEHDQLLDNAVKQPRRNGYVCVKPSLDSQTRKHLHCGKCRIDFKSIEGFDAHNELIHFKCQHCRKRFADRSLLKRHACVHKGPQYIICTICGYTFKSKYCLAIHKKIHSQTFPYKCVLCSKECTSGMYLWKHNQTYHPHINGVFSAENSLK